MATTDSIIGQVLVEVDTSEYLAKLKFSNGSVLRCFLSEVLSKDEYASQLERRIMEVTAEYEALNANLARVKGSALGAVTK
jgi:hypothetical protein